MQRNLQFKQCCRLYTELSKTEVENGAAKLCYRSLQLRRAHQYADIISDVNVGTSKKQWMHHISDSRSPVRSFITDSMTSTMCQYWPLHSTAVQHTYNTCDQNGYRNLKKNNESILIPAALYHTRARHCMDS